MEAALWEWVRVCQSSISSLSNHYTYFSSVKTMQWDRQSCAMVVVLSCCANVPHWQCVCIYLLLSLKISHGFRILIRGRLMLVHIS